MPAAALHRRLLVVTAIGLYALVMLSFLALRGPGPRPRALLLHPGRAARARRRYPHRAPGRRDRSGAVRTSDRPDPAPADGRHPHRRYCDPPDHVLLVRRPRRLVREPAPRPRRTAPRARRTGLPHGLLQYADVRRGSGKALQLGATVPACPRGHGQPQAGQRHARAHRGERGAPTARDHAVGSGRA